MTMPLTPTEGAELIERRMRCNRMFTNILGELVRREHEALMLRVAAASSRGDTIWVTPIFPEHRISSVVEIHDHHKIQLRDWEERWRKHNEAIERMALERVTFVRIFGLPSPRRSKEFIKKKEQVLFPRIKYPTKQQHQARKPNFQRRCS